jgi:pSer/pThr/pTyr-binding forkhead associated (FHA) protein
MNYLDFDLLIERAGEKYKARVLNSPAGQATTEFILPFTGEGLENFVLKIGRPRRVSRRADSPEMETAKNFGGALFDAVFQDDVHTCFRGSLDEATRQEEGGLRVRLRLADAPELADVPWEFLYNPAVNRFLSLSNETPVVRYLDLPERIRSLAVSPPLRILVMISSPSDFPQLNVEQEWGKLNEALDDLKRRGLVELHRLDRASLIALQKQLRQDEYHIFHFVGHGGIDKQTREGVLILEDENGLSRQVSGQDLGTLLHDERTLRLALLNACEGARNARNDPFAGVAQSLLQQGIPAVIAMQFEVTDDVAITLAHQFYDALSEGYPVDFALTEARKAIYTLGNNAEWGTPVLYMRSPDGRIFNFATDKAQPRPPASLVVQRGAQAGQKFSLDAASSVIGRDEGHAVVLLDPQVSRSHARIVWMADRYILEDLGSANGTFVNSNRLTEPQRLSDGEEIGVGNTLLVFQLKRADSNAPDQSKSKGSAFSKTTQIIDPPPGKTAKIPRARIFISYKRNLDPDQAVAQQVYQALQSQHDVFIDQNMAVGTPWVERIMKELHESDFLIALLSAHAVQSEMLQHEIATAHELAKRQNDRPRILPVRLAFREQFQYPLNTYLDPINWASWQTSEDTPRLIDELKRAIAGEDLPISGPPPKIEAPAPQPNVVPPPRSQAPPLDMPEGTMELQSPFYVKRNSDDIALAAIARQGVTITIKAPRQMGKSSLLIRTMAEARKLGKRVAFLDFQLFEKATLNNAETFFRQFCALLTFELEMEDRLEEYWKAPLGNNQRCSRYVSRYLLANIKQPLVLAMDEVESIFDTEFRSDFFGMLRTWHNNRATDPIWKQLDLALVTSTEPYQLIENLNQSPFNVGEVIDLLDFTPEQVTQLNQIHGSPLTPGEEQQLMMLIGGHPYLVRRALYLVASKRISATELFSQASDDRGPFGDHLRYHLFRLYGKKDLIDGFQQIIRNQTCPDDRVFFRLRGAGLVRQEARTKVVPRCQLYAIYFREHLHG